MYTVYYINWSKNLDLAVFEGSLTACKVYILANYTEEEAENFYILAPDGFTVVK